MINSPTRQTTPRTILVVEDEPTLATAIAQRITAEGWSARVASDGASAVQAAKQLRPDLVIMDIMLPVMDGLEATKRIVADRPVPVLILTARDAEADKVIGLGAGADDYMTKPFSMRELFALAFQGFFMMVCVGIYAVLVNAMTISSDLHEESLKCQCEQAF